MKIEDIAEIAHHVNRDYCKALGDFSQPVWEKAPQWQKDSAMTGVAFHVAVNNAGVAASHDSWMKEKIEDGWVYGPEKNPDAKQHPCIKPFEDLPVEQQAKDYIFRSVVRSLVKFLDVRPK